MTHPPVPRDKEGNVIEDNAEDDEPEITATDADPAPEDDEPIVAVAQISNQ
jgi:hypothetical protein